MKLVLELYSDQREQQGLQRGERNKSITIARNLIIKHMSIEDIV